MSEKKECYSSDYLVNIAREGVDFSDVDEDGKDSLIRALCERILQMEEIKENE